MTHARATIREAFVAALTAGGTAAGSNVFDHPSRTRNSFPSLSVVDVAEPQEVASMGPAATRRINRRLVLEVSAEVKQTSGYAAARDSLLAEVEAIFATASVAGVKQVTPAGFAADEDYAGEQPVAVGRQRFEIFYVTRQGDPSTVT